jgi:hypothetical protein
MSSNAHGLTPGQELGRASAWNAFKRRTCGFQLASVLGELWKEAGIAEKDIDEQITKPALLPLPNFCCG